MEQSSPYCITRRRVSSASIAACGCPFKANNHRRWTQFLAGANPVPHRRRIVAEDDKLVPACQSVRKHKPMSSMTHCPVCSMNTHLRGSLGHFMGSYTPKDAPRDSRRWRPKEEGLIGREFGYRICDCPTNPPTIRLVTSSICISSEICIEEGKTCTIPIT